MLSNPEFKETDKDPLVIDVEHVIDVEDDAPPLPPIDPGDDGKDV